MCMRGCNCNFKSLKKTAYINENDNIKRSNVDQNLCQKREIALLIKTVQGKYNFCNENTAKKELINNTKQYSRKNCADVSEMDETNEIINIVNKAKQKKEQPKQNAEVVNESKK